MKDGEMIFITLFFLIGLGGLIHLGSKVDKIQHEMEITKTIIMLKMNPQLYMNKDEK